MKKFLLMILIIFAKNLNAQTQIFKNFDFSNGEYALYLVDLNRKVIFQENDFGQLTNGIVPENYYTEDVKVLNEIKNNWIGEPVNYQHECSYNYYFYVTRNNLIVSKIRVNTVCNELITDWNNFQIKAEVIKKSFPSLQKFSVRKFTCANYAECDSFYTEIEKDPNYI